MKHCLLVLLLALAVHARPPERIDFPAGATSGSVRGVVTGSESREYLFRAQAGQKMKLGVSSKRAKWLVVQVPAPDRTALAQRGEVSLPASGDYLLRLSIRSPEARRGERVEYQARLTILPLEAVDADTVPAGQAKTGAYRQGVAFEGGKPADGLTVSRLDLSPQPDCERLVVRFENGPRPGRFKVEPHPQGGGMDVTLLGVRRFEAAFPKPPPGSALDRFAMLPYQDDSGCKFSIDARREEPFEVYELANPARLVIDFQGGRCPSRLGCRRVSNWKPPPATRARASGGPVASRRCTSTWPRARSATGALSIS